MLLKFEIENWKSYKGLISFSMAATKERQHGEKLSIVPKYNLRVSPIGLIFGGNASGKSCFITALQFVQDYIIIGEKVLSSYKPHLLSEETENGPSTFSLEILINDTIYTYSFSINRQKVLTEKLTQTNSRNTFTLFRRVEEKFIIDPENKIKGKDRERLDFVARGTRSNRLFLTNSMDQQVKTWEFLFNWFRRDLVIIHPNTSISPSTFVDQPDLVKLCSEALSDMDTGIFDISTETVSISSLNLPSEIIEMISDKIDEDSKMQLQDNNGRSYIFEMKDGKIYATRLKSIHKTSENNYIDFDMSNESDGTQRILELIPAFSMLNEKKSHKVIVIDELDRSLHSLMSLHLLKNYLCTCGKESRTQLIFTTHDVMLMDQDIFRRDQIWLVNKNKQNQSELRSMKEFKDIRYDKDIRKSYLDGKIGGIPSLRRDCK